MNLQLHSKIPLNVFVPFAIPSRPLPSQSPDKLGSDIAPTDYRAAPSPFRDSSDTRGQGAQPARILDLGSGARLPRPEAKDATLDFAFSVHFALSSKTTTDFGHRFDQGT